MIVGKSVKRVDAYDKVTGKAKYTDDLCPKNALVAKILHSTIANGQVKAIDTSQALKIPGVVKIVTCFDVPQYEFPTAGHPWSTEKAHQDVADRLILNQRVRYYGDDIAAVVADNEVAANRALKAIRVEYIKYPPLLNVFDAMKEGAAEIHQGYKNNILAHSKYELGDYEQAMTEKGLRIVEGEYETSIVQHCHIEPPSSFAYMEGDRIIVTTSTQIPHIVRRVVGQALGVGWGKICVIKPYIGGGFGNKQDVLYEPLNAFLTMAVHGQCVKLIVSREETFASTRVRHKIHFKISSAVREDGVIVARKIVAYSDQGAYASHAHAIVANAITCFRQLYRDAKAVKGEAFTVYTNKATGGAMRGYGIPQIIFACESHMDDIARQLNISPCDLREKNCLRSGFDDPILNGISCRSDALLEFIKQGKETFDWDNKIKQYRYQTGNIRRGVGMALFSYKTGVYPISLETASSRLMLNEDGSVQLQMGATEIGQGADTVFSQMAAETIGIPFENVHIVSFQNTDVTPFDTGAYASRQTYVSGMAVKKAAQQLKEKIVGYAAKMLSKPMEQLDICDGFIVEASSGEPVLSVADVAMESCYSLSDSEHITAEATQHCTSNTIALGATFAEIEVDMALGKITVLRIHNFHDSGKLINPKLAEAQVHGGMSMGLGYAISEQLLYNEKGRPLNNNLLDYKLPTSMDTPSLSCTFLETDDPTGPYGNKALGEPPTISPAPAIRNALLNATGVAFNSIPFNPQKLFERFAEEGLIET